MLNISSFSPGFYMIEVSVGDSKKVSKKALALTRTEQVEIKNYKRKK